MSLKLLDLPATLNTSTADIIAEFFVPALTGSVRYDRGVGFFSAGWLRIAAEGMTAFASNSGRARWVTSPVLSEGDWQALQLGEAARTDEVLRRAIERNLDDLERALQEETLSALAWLVADGILNFKLALPRNKLERGEFHDKFGIFSDGQGQQVSFNGSPNDSVQGTHNYESIKIFCSWHPAFAGLVQADAERFERLWNDQDPNVQVFALPQAAHAHIVRLRRRERPYPEPNREALRRLHEAPPPFLVQVPGGPHVPPHITLRDYQSQAIDAWFAHDCRGLLEMATGTGKTITALAATARLYRQEERLAVIVAVPYQHLVDQWQVEAEAFGYQPTLAYRSKDRWLDRLNNQITEFNGGYRPFISAITTHSTFIRPAFQASVAQLEGPAVIIADEAHHLGAKHSRQAYPPNLPYRLALSATPDRWYDDAGTEALRAYFGQTVFAFPLERAIGVSLTPYYYYPHLVPLTDEEMARYEKLSARITQWIDYRDQEEENGERALMRLLLRRASLLNKAQTKLEVLSELVNGQEEIQHTLFYCAPGQIDQVLPLLGWEKGLLVHRFTAEEDTEERQRLLTDFATGDLQALVAMKCLDEGIDVPNTRTAFILASSSNPRQFIQRRGRILRQAPGKDFSTVHDLITVPPAAWAPGQALPTSPVERNLIRRELRRFKEFAHAALNKHQALDIIWDVAHRYRLLDF